MAFGEIDEIIPDFHCPTDTISIWNQTEYFAKNNLLPFRLGARSFSLQTKRELIRYLERVKSDAVADIDAMRKAHRQIFLLTMRQGRRTATNQAAFLEAVCRALAGRYPDSGFLFDSYSRPRVPQPGHIQQRGEEDVVLARKLASHIFEKIPAAGCCMAGLDIVDALYATLSIDYYISHHGTQQNKVSWLSSAPGFVHSNERYLAGPQNTPAIAEGTPQPRYISIDYIKEIDSGPAWIRDYEIDIDGAIAEILEDVETVLGMSGQSRKMPGE
jgi:hypothetical protein